jgi:hypothetical protein
MRRQKGRCEVFGESQQRKMCEEKEAADKEVLPDLQSG